MDYATSDGSAQAASDYTAASGTLTFNPGDTSKTIKVAVLTDSDLDALFADAELPFGQPRAPVR